MRWSKPIILTERERAIGLFFYRSGIEVSFFIVQYITENECFSDAFKASAALGTEGTL